jgi:hypothetical protein
MGSRDMERVRMYKLIRFPNRMSHVPSEKGRWGMGGRDCERESGRTGEAFYVWVNDWDQAIARVARRCQSPQPSRHWLVTQYQYL